MNAKKSLMLGMAVVAGLALPAFGRDHGWGGHHHGGPHYGGSHFSFGFGIGAPLYTPYYARPYPPVIIAPPVSAPLVIGPEVAADVQRVLSRYRYYQGAIDGVLGPRSQAAIRTWQADHGLPVTGTPDSLTLRSLGLLN